MGAFQHLDSLIIRHIYGFIDMADYKNMASISKFWYKNTKSVITNLPRTEKIFRKACSSNCVMYIRQIDSGWPLQWFIKGFKSLCKSQNMTGIDHFIKIAIANFSQTPELLVNWFKYIGHLNSDVYEIYYNRLATFIQEREMTSMQSVGAFMQDNHRIIRKNLYAVELFQCPHAANAFAYDSHNFLNNLIIGTFNGVKIIDTTIEQNFPVNGWYAFHPIKTKCLNMLKSHLNRDDMADERLAIIRIILINSFIFENIPLLEEFISHEHIQWLENHNKSFVMVACLSSNISNLLKNQVGYKYSASIDDITNFDFEAIFNIFNNDIITKLISVIPYISLSGRQLARTFHSILQNKRLSPNHKILIITTMLDKLAQYKNEHKYANILKNIFYDYLNSFMCRGIPKNIKMDDAMVNLTMPIIKNKSFKEPLNYDVISQISENGHLHLMLLLEKSLANIPIQRIRRLFENKCEYLCHDDLKYIIANMPEEYKKDKCNNCGLKYIDHIKYLVI